MVIERRSLRSQVKVEILARMRDGRVSPGEAINEGELAAQLGVSRTPLREALIALEYDGQIDSEAGRGFKFLPLSIDELVELGSILAVLEGLAIEQSDPETMAKLGAELLERARDFGDDVAPLRVVNTRDQEWHELMISACRNKRLVEMIGSTRTAFVRYESHLVSEDLEVGRVVAEHIAIAEALIAGDTKLAGLRLKSNWKSGAQRISAASSNQRSRST